jgi:hypothetical protein
MCFCTYIPSFHTQFTIDHSIGYFETTHTSNHFHKVRTYNPYQQLPRWFTPRSHIPRYTCTVSWREGSALGKHRASGCNWFRSPNLRIFNRPQNFLNLSSRYKTNLSKSLTLSKDCCQQKLVRLFADGRSLSSFYARASKLPSTQTSTILFSLTFLQACEHSR